MDGKNWFWETLSVVGTTGIWFSAFVCVFFGLYALGATGKCLAPLPKIIEAKIIYEDEEKIVTEITLENHEESLPINIYFIKRHYPLVRSEDGTKIILFKQMSYFCRGNVTFYSSRTTNNIDNFKQYDVYENIKEELSPEIIKIILILASLVVTFSLIVIVSLFQFRNRPKNQ